ncbi:MAG: alpha/beta hydrolase fold domain-containing protein [Magnetococcales bacterium]|nr:alpha/beta hydrolase fold domain-containing protein [Magnetococcales bacterium]
MPILIHAIKYLATGFAISLVTLLYPVLYIFQDNMLFFPRPLAPASKQILQHQHPGGMVNLQTVDKINLQGWMVNTPKRGKKPIMLYFGGNAEEVSSFLLTVAPKYPEWVIMAVNYRGYGESGGEPSEKALYSDALLAYDWVVAQPGIDGDRVVVMGRSLGSGVAVYLAAQRKVAGTILVSPYDSIKNIAQDIYPYVPVALLLKHPFKASSYAPTIKVPLLAIIADGDQVIPNRYSRGLIAKWGGPHQLKKINNVGHNTISSGVGYYKTIADYLAAVAK